MTTSITLISSEQALAIRHPVLRPGRPKETAIFDGDALPSTFHLGAFLGRALVGVATFFENPRPGGEERSYQLRGMATTPSAQGRGVGSSLLQSSFERLRAMGVPSIWCNARKVAFQFYQRNGFEFDSELFEIPMTGPHRRMVHWIQPETMES